MANMQLDDYAARAKQDVETALAALLPPAAGEAAALHAAMRWAVEGGGKRIRPLVCLAAAEAVGGAAADALMPACAIELLHSYTLVHDDLPAMDGDTERRGRPSVWAKFGEAVAILAGDALQALAFAALAQMPERCPGVRAALMAILSEAAAGVVCGQAAELSGSKNVGYIYTTAQELKELGVTAYTATRGYVNTMADLEGISIWAAFAEGDEGILCELRSSGPNINPIAVKYGGGGHKKASGATLKDRETVQAMLRDLDETADKW